MGNDGRRRRNLAILSSVRAPCYRLLALGCSFLSWVFLFRGGYMATDVSRTPEPTLSPPTPAADLSSGSATARVRTELPRRLGFWETTLIVIGVTIGSGIFRVPASVADTVGSPGGVAAVWIAGGVISLCAALALAELAAAFPEPGGIFVYLREVYGPAVAFLFGWMYLFVGPTGIAAVAVAFGEYLGRLVGLSPMGVRFAAAGAIVFAAAASYRSVRAASAMQGAATLGKVAALAAIVVTAFLFGNGGAIIFTDAGHKDRQHLPYKSCIRKIDFGDSHFVGLQSGKGRYGHKSEKQQQHNFQDSHFDSLSGD